MPHSASITGVADIGQHQVTEEQQKLAALNTQPPSPFPDEGYSNLASSSLGARILFATDDWFATAECLLKDGAPQFDPDAYCEQGKVMDGWETRRRREAGHDWAILKLSSKGTVVAVEIDTAHFTGNHVPQISLEIAELTCTEETQMVMRFPHALQRLLYGGIQGTGASPAEVSQALEAVRQLEWRTLLPKTALKAGYEASRMHYFRIPDGKSLSFITYFTNIEQSSDPFFFSRSHTFGTGIEGTHVRVNYYPDGGVARLRLWGTPLSSPGPKVRAPYIPIKTGRTCSVVSHSETNVPSRQHYEYPEISCQDAGGIGLCCSNSHYGNPWNLIQSSLGRDMGDGFETRRHPSRPGVLVKDPATNLVASDLSDWCVIKLGSVASEGIARIILDTKHFRGNYPESSLVEGCYAEADDNLPEGAEWFPLIPRGRMAPDSEHVYERSKAQITNGDRPVTHIKITIFPDGGLSRVRVYAAPGPRQ